MPFAIPWSPPHQNIRWLSFSSRQHLYWYILWQATPNQLLQIGLYYLYPRSLTIYPMSKPSLLASNAVDYLTISSVNLTLKGNNHLLDILTTVVPLYLLFHFPWFQWPAINHGPKIFYGKFQKQFINFKLCTVLRSIIKSCPILPRVWSSPLSRVSTLYMLPKCWSLRSKVGYQIYCHYIAVFVFKLPYST